MRRMMSMLSAGCLLASGVPPAMAQTNPNAGVCASDDDSAVSAEQRIAACTAMVEATKDVPAELSVILVNRASAYWFINKMPQAIADLDRATALEPKNVRAFRERAKTYRTLGRLDLALADSNQAYSSRLTTPKTSMPGAMYSTLTANMTAPSRTITKRSGSIRISRSPSWTAASQITFWENTRRRSPTTTPRSGSIPSARAPIPIAALPIRKSAAPIAPSRTKVTRSSSIPWCRNISTTADYLTPSMATTTAPLSTITRRSGLRRKRIFSPIAAIPIMRKAIGPRHFRL